MKYPKDVILKNSEHVLIRPYSVEDETRLQQFYNSIPPQERWFIPYDMMKHEMQCQWSEDSGRECLFSIIALCNDQIVAHANLLEGSEGHYAKHVGRLHVKVVPAFRGQRLGTWMILDLIRLAMKRELRDLRIDLITGTDEATIEGLGKLDFYKQAVLENYIIDADGNRRDLVIMTKKLHKDFGDF